MKPKAVLKAKIASVVETVDTTDLKSVVFERTGSSPVARTNRCMDVTLLRKGNDGRIQVFTATPKGFGWVRSKHASFGVIDLIIENDGEAGKFVEEARKAGMRVLFPR